MQLDNIRFTFGRAIRKDMSSILSTVAGAILLGISVFISILLG